MKSAQALRSELLTLHRTLQAKYNTIAYHKSGANLVAAFFNPNLRRQSLQTIAHERREIENTLLQLQDVQEQHFAALFLECWQDELSHLPDSSFLTEETMRRQYVYADRTCPSLSEHLASF
jgi:hypothetical protein